MIFTPPPLPAPRPAREEPAFAIEAAVAPSQEPTSAAPEAAANRDNGAADDTAGDGEDIEVERAGTRQAPASAGGAPATRPSSRAAAVAAAFSGPARAAEVGVGNPLPSYPFAARRQGLEGRTVIRVRVSPLGEAARVSVLESSGHRTLDGAALRALSDWRFVPALRNGRPVESTVDVPVTFRLDD